MKDWFSLCTFHFTLLTLHFPLSPPSPCHPFSPLPFTPSSPSPPHSSSLEDNMPSPWVQNYDPLGLRVALDAGGRAADRACSWACWWRGLGAAGGLAGLAAALAVAIFVFEMPAESALAAAGYGACFGLLPIGWIVLAAVFLYHLTVRTGQFEIVKRSVTAISPDRRMQALLDRLLLRHVSGRGGRLRHARGHLGRAADRPGLLAALRRRAGPDGQHLAGGLRRPWARRSSRWPRSPASTRWRCSQMAGRQLPLFSLMIPAGWWR